MLAFGHFGDQFFHDDVHHGAGGEGEKVGHHGYDGFGGEDREEGRDGFDDAGDHAEEKRLPFLHAFRAEGHGDDGAFGEVLDGDADGQGERAGSADAGVACEEAGVNDADGHAFGDVVERDREYQFCGAFQSAFRSFFLIVKM